MECQLSDVIVIPPPIQFEDQATEMLSSSSSPLPGCEQERRCIWKNVDCNVNTLAPLPAVHLTPSCLPSDPQTQEFSLSGLTQQIPLSKKSSPRDGKLFEIERKFEIYLQESMSSYLEENFSTPTYFEQSNQLLTNLDLPPPIPKAAMNQSTPTSAGRGKGPPIRLQGLGGGQRLPLPGGGGGGGGQGPGGQRQGPGGVHPPPSQPPQGPPRKLTVTTTPDLWGVQDPSHTKAICNPTWTQKFNELHNFVSGRFDSSFEWLDDQGELRGGADQVDSDMFKITQFLAMMVTWVSRQDTPGSMDPNDQIDFFDYAADNGFLTGSTLSFDPSNILSGVQLHDPRNYFSPVEHLDKGETPDEVCLRPALVLFYHLLQDLSFKNVRLEVKLRYNGATEAMTVKYTSSYIHDTLAPAILHVATVLDSVFSTQSAARRLGDCLKEINEEAGRRLEEMVCQFALSPGAVDHGKFQASIQTKLIDANRVLAAYEEYEDLARKTSGGFSLTNQYSQQTFDNLNLTIKFLENSSEPSMPWIQNSGKFCPGVVRATLGDERLKMLSCPSRLFLPKSTTSVSDQVEIIKKLVNQGSQLWMDYRASARPGPVPAAAAGGGHDRRPEEVHRPDHPPGAPLYPSSLLADAAILNDDIVIQPDLRSQEVFIIQDYLDRVQICIKEIQRYKWQGLVLSPADEEVFASLSSLRPILCGYITEHKQRQRNEEAREREIARNVTMTSAPKLDDDGTQIQEFLQFHKVFSSASPLARSLKIKQGLSKNLAIRCQNMIDPDEILQLLSSLYLQEDILVPKILFAVQQLKSSPPVNSKTEAENFCGINSLITKLKTQNLLHKLDYTTMQICLSKLSRVRTDEYERVWYAEQAKIESLPAPEQEAKKRDIFLSWIQINERLIHRRLLQNSITGSEKKQEKVFSTSTDNQTIGRETRYDRRQRKSKDEGRDRGGTVGGSGAGAGRPPADVTCPMPGCQAPGHPRVRPPNVGGSIRNLSRCPILRATSQGAKLALVESVGGCRICLNSSHISSQCSLPVTTPWLAAGHGEECRKPPGHHHPSICPYIKPTIERSNVTMNKDNNEADIVVNLAERVTVKDLSGKPHNLLGIFDNASDSCWCSSEVASSFPPSKKHKVTLNLSTMSGLRPFQTYQHTLQIVTKQGLKKVHFYESPNIGEIKKCNDLEIFLDHTVQVPIELLEGKVDLLLGLKAMSCHPVSTNIPSPAGSPNLKIFSSSIHENKFLVAGSVDRRMLREGGTEDGRNVSLCLYTKGYLMESILKDRELDEAMPICALCQERCKQCQACQLAAKPMSLAEMREIEMIRKNMVFDKENQRVSTKYESTISTFKQLFPKHLSNEKAAQSISARMLSRLRKSGELEVFHNAFMEMVDKGIVEELTPENIKEWDEQDGPVNYISFHSTFKAQTSEDKIKCRVVTNSSLQRYCQVGDKKIKSSLNSLLPQGSPRFQSITDVLLRWISKPVSLCTDIKAAYTTIRPMEGLQGSQEWTDGQTMRNIRRLVWYKQPLEADPVPTTYCLARVHWGDACAAGCLQELVNQVGRDLQSSKGDSSAKMFRESNFVDDSICGLDSTQQAFTLFKDIEDSFKNYNAQLHTPIVCSQEGKFDDVGKEPRKVPDKNETRVARTLGFSHDFFEDTITVDLNRNLNKRTRGLRPGKDLEPGGVNNLKITQRSLAAFQQSQFDVLNLVAPVLIKGKLLLSRVQKLLNPSIKENWDCSLPPELETEAREYINNILTMSNPVFDRFSPPGTLKQLFLHHDGSASVFASVLFGIFIEEDGNRNSKLLYSKPRISHRTVPDVELQSLHQSSEMAKSLIKLFPSVQSICLFGDSESALKQLSSLKKPKCVFTNNKINQVIANFQEVNDSGVVIKSFQVASRHNMADRVTKYIKGAEMYVHSDEWKKGPSWFREKEDMWPTLRSYYLGDGRLVEEGQNGVGHPDLQDHVAQHNQAAEDEDDADEDVGQEDDDDGGEDAGQEEDEDEDNEVPIEVSYYIGEDVQYDSVDYEDNIIRGKTDDDEGDDIDHGERDKNGALKTETEVQLKKEPTYSELLNNVSSIRLAARSIARIRNAFKRKSFKAIQENPSEDQEREAFLLICKDQQRGREEEIMKSGIKAFQQDGLFYSSQRWSSEMHKMLFGGVDKLPVVALKDRLGVLLLHRAHRPPNSPCLTDDHAKSAIRNGPFQALLFGGSERQELSKIRHKCAICRKMKLEIKGGELSNFKPEMKKDEFKTLSCPFFTRISIDTTGPILVCESETGVSTRARKRYQKRHILIISDLVGSGAVRFKQIASTSAASVILGLQQHIAEVGQIPQLVYHDSASSFRSIATREGAEPDNKHVEKLQKEGEKELTKAFPTTTFRDCGSSSQNRNALAERGVFFLKRYIRSSLGLKPKSPLPQFSCFGLNCFLSLAESVANSRPLTYLKKTGTFITSHHLLRTSGASYLWNEDDSIQEKFTAIQEYKTRMLVALTDELKQLNFLPQKWKKEGPRAQIGDFIMISRQKSKVNPLGLVEFGIVQDVLDNGRNLKVRVARSHTQKKELVRELIADSRNCYLIHREEE